MSSGLDGAVYGWDWRAGKRTYEFVHKRSQFTCAVPSADGGTSYAVSRDGRLCMADMRTGAVVQELSHDEAPGLVALGMGGRFLFSALSSTAGETSNAALGSAGAPTTPGMSGAISARVVGSIMSYPMPFTTKQSFCYPAASGAVTRLMLTPDQTHLITAGVDGSICVMEVRDKDGRIPLVGTAGASQGGQDTGSAAGSTSFAGGATTARLPWADEVLMTRTLLEEMAR